MVSIAEAERIRNKCVSESRIRAAETRKRAANRQGLGLPAAAAQTVYAIVYDINAYSCMISYPTQVL